MEYRLRPSAAAVWVKCAGSIRLAQGLPFPMDDTDPTVREEGTACHWVAQLAAHGHAVAEGVMSPNGQEVTQEMLDAADTYIGALQAWATPDVVRHMEQPVHCAGIHPECGGTPDAAAWAPLTRTIYIGDLKFGYRNVSPVRNWQMLCYVDGFMRYLHLQPQDVQRVVFTIVQPRAGGVKEYACDMQEVAGHWATLRAAAHAAVAPQADCVTNEGCLNCAARVRCPAAHAAATDIFDVCHTATPHDLPFVQAEAELRMLQWAGDIIAARTSAMEQQLTHQLKRGAISKDYTLEPKVGRLAWKDEAAQTLAIGMAAAMGKDIYKPRQLITPTQATAKLGEPLVSTLAHRPQGGLKLVRRSESMMSRIFGKK